MDDISDIREMYNGYCDREDARLQRHQLEHDVTWRYLERYLPPPGSNLIEIGCATGRYSLECARRGYKMLSYDLSPAMVARARQGAAESELDSRVEFKVADIRELTDLSPEAYDAALVMGPLYHLILREDRLLALRNVYRSLKKGGILISSWISRYGIFGQLLKEKADIVSFTEQINCLLELGYDLDFTRVPSNFRGYFAVVDEIAPIHEEAGFSTLALAGVEPAISADDESYNKLEGEQRRMWLDLLFRLSAVPAMILFRRTYSMWGKNKNQFDPEQSLNRDVYFHSHSSLSNLLSSTTSESSSLSSFRRAISANTLSQPWRGRL